MPYIPPSTITDVDRAVRKKLHALLWERAVMTYAFSWEKLIHALIKITESATALPEGELVEILKSCVIAFTEEEAKEHKAILNDKIADIYDDFGVKTLRDSDPFGRIKDYIMQNGTSTSCPQKRVLEIAVSKYGINADKLAQAFEDATIRSPFVTVQARDVKESPDEAPAPAPASKKKKH